MDCFNFQFSVTSKHLGMETSCASSCVLSPSKTPVSFSLDAPSTKKSEMAELVTNKFLTGTNQISLKEN